MTDSDTHAAIERLSSLEWMSVDQKLDAANKILDGFSFPSDRGVMTREHPDGRRDVHVCINPQYLKVRAERGNLGG